MLHLKHLYASLHSLFFGADQKDILPVNRYEGFQSDAAVVLSDRRGTVKAEMPEAEGKGFGGSDPLAIWKPTGTKSVDAAKAMGNFTGWTYAAVNAIVLMGTRTRRCSCLGLTRIGGHPEAFARGAADAQNTPTVFARVSPPNGGSRSCRT